MRVMFIGGPLDNTIRDIGRIGDRMQTYVYPADNANYLYYPVPFRSPVGHESVMYATGFPSENAVVLCNDRLQDPQCRTALIECYGAEFFEEWHSVMFTRAGERALHGAMINDSHTKLAIESDRIRGTDLSRRMVDLVITLGGEHVPFSVTPQLLNNGIFTIFDLHPEAPKVKAKTYKDHEEYRQFILAICHTPADDMPRLVFADYLEEKAAGVCEACGGSGKHVKNWDCQPCHGTGTNGAAERAEFIRLGIEIESLIASMPEPPCKENARAYEVNKRLRVLEKHFDFGLGHMRQDCTIRRGFVSEIRLTLAQFEQHAGRIAAEHPVEKWVLTDREPYQNDNDKWIWFWVLNPETARLNDSLMQYAGGEYPTREAAIEALSRAAYPVARQRAERLENADDIVDAINALPRRN